MAKHAYHKREADIATSNQRVAAQHGYTPTTEIAYGGQKHLHSTGHYIGLDKQGNWSHYAPSGKQVATGHERGSLSKHLRMIYGKASMSLNSQYDYQEC